MAVPEIEVVDISIDSREVTPGYLFCAYRGEADDGRRYIDAAVAAGAAAVLYDPDGFHPGAVDAPCIALPGLRHRVGEIAARLFGDPNDPLRVIGVTGTNGKTSCCFMLAQALNLAGHRAAVIGTLGAGVWPKLESRDTTTPDPVSLQRDLAALRSDGVGYVCLEVSSHALTQGRVAGIEFFATVFTNLSRDHLDYHADMQTYGAAKIRLFRNFPGPVGVVNVDDVLAESLLAESVRQRHWTYGAGGDIELRAVRPGPRGLRLQIHEHSNNAGAGQWLDCKLIGRINAPNVLAVVATLRAIGIDPGDIPSLIAALNAPPGRMELFGGGAETPSVVVDYAHTPDALERALESLREHCDGRLWCVFGCGGDRDRGKRPLMGGVAERLADRVVITDDNPRGEAPKRIAADILAGMRAPAEVIHDRATAIYWSIFEAGGDDWVLVAGKGHEQYQIVGGQKRAFSDRAWVGECLERAA